MTNKISLLLTKIEFSFRSFDVLLKNYKYLLFILMSSLFFMELIYWSMNFQVMMILMSHISIKTMSAVFLSIFEAFDKLSLFFITLISLVQGTTLAAIVYVYRHRRKVDNKLLGEGLFISLLSILGIGCPTCGATLSLPLFTLFFGSFASFLLDKISLFIFPGILVVAIVGLYFVGKNLAEVKMQNKFKVG